MVGCYFADFLPVLCSGDLLQPSIKYKLDSEEWISTFKNNVLKKNSQYVKDI